MRKILIIVIITTFYNCGSIRPNASLTLNTFLKLEELKCKEYGIEEYLLNSGNFKSTGTTKMKFGSPAKNFVTLSKHRKFIIINYMEDNEQYNFLSIKPDAYNYIRKNGEFIETVTNSGITNLVYKMNNSKYLLEMKEEYFEGMNIKSYKIVSWCYYFK